MFENLPDTSGVKYMVKMLESAARDEEWSRRAVIRHAEWIKEQAERAADGREYREISQSNPDPITVYSDAVMTTRKIVEIFRAVAWAAMTDIDTAAEQEAQFKAWVEEAIIAGKAGA